MTEERGPEPAGRRAERAAPPSAERIARAAEGRAARKRVPRSTLAEVAGRGGRPGALDLLEAQATTRLPDLVPVRYGRMAESPFAYLRGSAVVMAADLGASADSGLGVQLCGDAHVANFGTYGSPERNLVFDLNDFDESHPGPFEWDVKRLLASLEVVARTLDVGRRRRREIVVSAARAYREAVRDFAGQTALAVWYARIDLGDLVDAVPHDERMVRRARSALDKARRRDHLQAAARLTRVEGDERRFVADPPLVSTLEDVLPADAAPVFRRGIADLLVDYRASLAPDRRRLAERYRVVDIARKVVGVGSVGTRAFVVLLQGVDSDDVLVLQAKEAQASVLEPHVGRGAYAQQGQRVVEGQRLMQAVSDVMLGWQRSAGPDGVARDYYVRQLRDWKGGLDLTGARPAGLEVYGRLCAWTLARAHARSGDAIAIGAYLGGSSAADEALADFAATYADRTEADHAELEEAVDDGRLPVVRGV
ncbi:DUF2252 domain-containing protein [Cellulomonas algicola]|uniref:DUF2252 domain-containing protein n=1 Tax=Cellulomonas algicola TaxID=2071633 RepID=UPI001C3FD7F6|nr:DUF2252 domain-containing protein [Cellulomonas algicola]